MCYNCGCGKPDEDHGRGHAGVDPQGKAITEKTFEVAGEAFGIDKNQAKTNTHDLLMSEPIRHD